MPYTYEFIASSILNTNTATVTFSNIPQTYTDLEFRIMAKGNDGAATFTHMIFTVNNNGSAIYDYIGIRGNGDPSPSQQGIRGDNAVYAFASYIQGPGANANSYGTSSLYFSNYANTSMFKNWTYHSANELNVTPRYIGFAGGKIETNSAITSIEFLSNQFSITNYQAGSEFHLYGIKKS